MRILVHVHLRTMLRHFERVILALAERGHTVQIASTGFNNLRTLLALTEATIPAMQPSRGR